MTLAGWLAWHTGVIAQIAKIPPLSDLLPPEEKPRGAVKRTPEQLLSIAMAWNAAVRGDVVPRSAV